MYQGKLIDVTGTCPIKNLNPAREANETHQQYKDRKLSNQRAMYGYSYYSPIIQTKQREAGYRDGKVVVNEKRKFPLY